MPVRTWPLPSDLTDAEWALLEPFFHRPLMGDARANGRSGGLSNRSFFSQRPAVADAAALLPAGLHGAALVLSVAGQQAVVVTK